MPDHFDISPTTQVNLLERVLSQLETKRINLNLTAAQFLDQEYADNLVRFKQSNPQLLELTVEMTELPNDDAIIPMAAQYHAAGIRVGIDDVGSDNTFDMIKGAFAYVDGMKFAMQNLRRDHQDAKMRSQILFWQKEAAAANLSLTLEGIETDEDVALAKELKIEFGQGYHFAKPELPRINA